jgi:hypothetical protein
VCCVVLCVIERLRVMCFRFVAPSWIDMKQEPGGVRELDHVLW